MGALIEKVQHGYRVDGLDLVRSNCGCGSLSGSGGVTGDCCHTFSTVKHEGEKVFYVGKATTPNTTNNYKWGYRVKKGAAEVDVTMFDTRSPKTFKFGGVQPPALAAWKQKGWEVVEQFEEPLEGSGVLIPEWAPTGADRTRVDLESPHGTKR